MKMQMTLRKRNSAKVLLNILTMVILLLSLCTEYAQAEAQRLKGKPYFADVDTNYPAFGTIKYCNEHNVFGKKRGKNFYMRPEKLVDKEQAVKYLYNLLHKEVGFGDGDYRKSDSKSWQWAMSNDIIKRNEKPKDPARYKWFDRKASRCVEVLGDARGVILMSITTGDSTEGNPHLRRNDIMWEIYCDFEIFLTGVMSKAD